MATIVVVVAYLKLLLLYGLGCAVEIVIVVVDDICILEVVVVVMRFSLLLSSHQLL